MNKKAILKGKAAVLEKIGNVIANIINLNKSFAQYEILIDYPDIPIIIKCSSSLKSVEVRGKVIFLNATEGDNIINLPLYEWLKKYFQSGNTSITVKFFLENYNTVAAHPLLNLFSNLNYLNKSNHLVMIDWYYDSENDYMLEIGEALANRTSCKFQPIMITTAKKVFQ